MRTKFFQKVQLSDGGKDRLRALPKLPPEARTGLAKWFAESETLPTGKIGADAERLAASAPASVDAFMDAFSITSFIVAQLGEHGDNVADFVSDLRDIDFLKDESQYEILKEYLGVLEPHIKRLHLDDRRRRTQAAGAPQLDRTSIAVSIKPVFSKPFRYGEQEVLEYTPEIVDCTPVVQVELERSDTRQTFAFQLNEDGLNHFVADLLAAQAQFEAAKKLSARLSPTGK